MHDLRHLAENDRRDEIQIRSGFVLLPTLKRGERSREYLHKPFSHEDFSSLNQSQLSQRP